MAKKYLISIIIIFVLGGIAILTPSVKALTVSPVRLEMYGDPGITVKGKIILLNEQAETKTFYSSFENFESRGETGNPYFLPGTEGLATWIKTSKQVTIKSGERKTIPFSVQIPQNADPGGHFAAIFWSTSPTKKEGGQVSVSAKIGVLVLLKVSGEIKEGGGLLEFSAKNNQKFFTVLPIHFVYRFKNGGGDRIKPKGDIKIENTFGMTKTILPANKSQGNVLPDSIRRFEVVWQEKTNNNQIKSVIQEPETNLGFFGIAKKQWKNFAFGLYKAKLNLNFGAKKSALTYVFFVIPWQLLSLMLIIILIIGFFGWMGVKRYNQWIINKTKISSR